MGSVKAMALIGALSLLTFAGCDSTQDKNTRAELRAKRELGGRKALSVTRAHRAVKVTGVALVRGKRSSAIVVDLRSRASEPLTDLPILVGVRGADGRRELLNAKGRFGWFQKHLPAIAANGRATWVFERKGSFAGTPFAKVGPASKLGGASTLPRIDADTDGRARRSKARVDVDNVSDIPQYGLQVYAVVRAHGRYVAAGTTELEHLGTGQRVTAVVPLAGQPGRRTPKVHAIPTMFD